MTLLWKGKYCRKLPILLFVRLRENIRKQTIKNIHFYTSWETFLQFFHFCKKILHSKKIMVWKQPFFMVFQQMMWKFWGQNTKYFLNEPYYVCFLSAGTTNAVQTSFSNRHEVRGSRGSIERRFSEGFVFYANFKCFAPHE